MYALHRKNGLKNMAQKNGPRFGLNKGEAELKRGFQVELAEMRNSIASLPNQAVLTKGRQKIITFLRLVH